MPIPPIATGRDNRLEELETMRGAPWLDMSRIVSDSTQENVAPGYIYLAYLESEALVLYVAKGTRWVLVPSMVDLRHGSTFDAAFQDVVGLRRGEDAGTAASCHFLNFSPGGDRKRPFRGRTRFHSFRSLQTLLNSSRRKMGCAER